MITINRERGCIILSRCEYLYRDGLDKLDETAHREMGDGDIVIPLPDHMMSREWDNRDDGKGRAKGSDGQSAEIIITEITRRLGGNAPI